MTVFSSGRCGAQPMKFQIRSTTGHLQILDGLDCVVKGQEDLLARLPQVLSQRYQLHLGGLLAMFTLPVTNAQTQAEARAAHVQF
ncbi:hypothetical protein [Pseudomonas phage Alpheus]|uniref:Uncharacterized protein n=1 Tax=Pseudomonas phage Alpheus TaxID=2163983 RepID=A0A2S1GMY4_9CAUD|nr:hypothetical protein HOT11_gp24 [Pseudomonas phage Alpheus]AWD90748.1 hypothetical protein [Pseudomonas phage Alpheus]